MIKKKDSYVKEIRKNMRGGDGLVEIMDLMPEEYANKKCRLFAKVTIREGSSIGMHTHIDETETYYILSGAGTVSDGSGKETVLDPGDAMYTGSGGSHTIRNTGSEDLVFIALILLD